MEVHIKKFLYPKIYRLDLQGNEIIRDETDREKMIASSFNYITKKYKIGQNAESNEDETEKKMQAMKETFIKSMSSALREINILCDNLFLTQKKYCLEMEEIKSPFQIEKPIIQLENKKNNLYSSANKLNEFCANFDFSEKTEFYSALHCLNIRWPVKKSATGFIGSLSYSGVGSTFNKNTQFRVYQNDKNNNSSVMRIELDESVSQIEFVLEESIQGQVLRHFSCINSQRIFNFLHGDKIPYFRLLRSAQLSIYVNELFEWLIKQYFDLYKFSDITNEIRCPINDSISFIVKFNQPSSRDTCSKKNCLLCRSICLIEYLIFSRLRTIQLSSLVVPNTFPSSSTFGFRTMQAFSEDWFENCDRFLHKTSANIFQDCISLIKLSISKNRFILDLSSGASKYQLSVTPRWIDSPDFSSSSTVLSTSFKFSTREIKSSFFYRIRPNLSFDCVFQHSSGSNFAITLDVLTRLSYDMFTGAIILSLTWLCDFFDFIMISTQHPIDPRATTIRITTNRTLDSNNQCVLVVVINPTGAVSVCYSHFNEISRKFENQNLNFSSVSSSTIMSKLIRILTLIYSYYQDSFIV